MAKPARRKARDRPPAQVALPRPPSRHTRGQINRIASATKAALLRLARLQEDGTLQPDEYGPAKAALEALQRRSSARLVRTDERAQRAAQRKLMEHQVLAALSTVKHYTALTVEDVLVRIMRRDRDSITAIDLVEVGKILTQAGWSHTRPRVGRDGHAGPGPARPRVYIGPPMLLFAEAGVGK